MNDFQRGITELVRSALLGTQARLPAAFDFSRALMLGKAHQILPLLYYGVQNSGLAIPAEIKSDLRTATLQSAMMDQRQKAAVEAIFSALEREGLDYMPLKGILRKAAYPKPEMRPMSDLDILIRSEQYGQIRPLMSELGFEECYESDHELVWKKTGGLLVELHKHIIPSYNRDYYAYFGDGWKLAHPVTADGHRYEMSSEDSLIYELTHMAKHYRDGGIGIRHLTDVWLCAQNGERLHVDYIRKVLQELKLWDFYENVLATGRAWFADGPVSDMTDFVTEFIFSSGAYGTMDRRVLSSGVRMAQTEGRTAISARWIKFLRSIFPPFCAMCKRYPLIAKVPVLLPIFWLIRWGQILYRSPSSVRKKVGELQKMTPEKIDQFQSALAYVGLCFEKRE